MFESIQQPRVLLVYATEHGSTEQVAHAVAEELRALGAEVEMSTAASMPDASRYDAVVVGGPMIMGWHRDALRYLTANRQALAERPTAYFVTALSLTDTGEHIVGGVPVAKDPGLARAPRRAQRLSLKERYALPSHYLGSALKKAPQVRPASIAFFGGALDPAKLNVLQRLFVSGVIGARAGDTRNWEFIRSWAESLVPKFAAAGMRGEVSATAEL